MAEKIPVMDRLWPRVRKGKCWTWQGSCTPDGYGKIRDDDGRLVLVHRVVYEEHKGPIPEGLELDHVVCQRRHCCNPDHLEIVTGKVNTMRGEGPTAKNARKKKCKRGHPLEGDNLIIQKEKDGTRRRCRACYRDRKRRAYAEGRYR